LAMVLNIKEKFAQNGKNVEKNDCHERSIEMKWEPLIENLTAGKIIPVIGNDLIRMKDKNGTLIPLYRHITRELTRTLKIQYTGQSIAELALAYPNENVIQTAESIFKKMSAESFNLELLEKLTGIRDFNFFISTTHDGLLVKALCTSRGLDPDQVEVIDYSLENKPKPSHKKGNEPLVTVFNVLGSFENIAEAACDEEKMLEHFFSLSNKYHRNRNLADYFMNQIKGKILLFIGCDFPDWFMRFIIRIITNKRYSDRLSSDYIVWDKVDRSTDVYKFFTRHKKNIYEPEGCTQGNVQRFIDELYDEWVKAKKELPPRYEGTVFLSYNTPDLEMAEQLKKLLLVKGIRSVWFDKDDLGVGEHESRIKEEIKKCKVFIPLISNHSLSAPDNSYVKRVEWASILGRFDADKYYGECRFQLIPIVIDNTDRSDDRIPKFMRDFTMLDFPKDRGRIIEVIQKELTPRKAQYSKGE
jgi:hypothetical protein